MAVHSKYLIQQNKYRANIVPSGVIDGINKIFMLPDIPLEGTHTLSLGGQTQLPGVGGDYVLSVQQIVFEKSPRTSIKMLSNYMIE